MANSGLAKLQFEAGQTLYALAAMTTTDSQVYKAATGVWSGKSGFTTEVYPNGVVSGSSLVTPAASGTNDLVDVAAFTAYSQGVLRSVSADTDVTITRGATANIGKISSITMTSAGAISVVAGTDSADATINDTRGGAGGPPEIPADSVEIAQVRFSGTGAGTAAAVTAAQIFQVPGQHHERYDYPGYTVNNIGEGIAATQANKSTAYVAFDSALPAIHASATPRKTWIKYYAPVFADISKANNFKAAEKTYSSSAESGYNFTVASTSESLGQGGFDIVLSDGVTDPIVAQNGKVLTFKFFQDRNKTPYILTQGTLGIPPDYPADSSVKATCTISAETASARFVS